MQVITHNNQSLLDIAIQTTGKAENLLKIAVANNISPTGIIAPGTAITIPENVVIDGNILKFYSANTIVPATGLSQDFDFIVLSCEEKLYNCFK